MTSKKSAKSKRTNPPRDFTRTKEFTKDWERISHSGRYDMNRLKKVMLLLIENAEPLPEQWLDHALTGQWSKHRECHIGGDFLLIYKVEKSSADERIIFVRAGTHADYLSETVLLGFAIALPNLRATGLVYCTKNVVQN